MIDLANFTGEGGTVLGEGQVGSERWELVFFSESEAPPNQPEDHSGPGLVMLRFAGAAGSCGPTFGLSSPFLEAWGMYDPSSALTFVYGQVAPEFHLVTVSCTDGRTVDGVIVECLDRFPFNYYVAVVPERPTEVTAIGEGVEPLNTDVSDWPPPIDRRPT